MKIPDGCKNKDHHEMCAIKAFIPYYNNLRNASLELIDCDVKTDETNPQSKNFDFLLRDARNNKMIGVEHTQLLENDDIAGWVKRVRQLLNDVNTRLTATPVFGPYRLTKKQ